MSEGTGWDGLLGYQLCKSYNSGSLLYEYLFGARFRLFRLGFQDDSRACTAVHHNYGRCREAQVAHAPNLLDGRLRCEPFPVYGTFASVRINGEVADLKSSEVLEEVAALRGRDAKVAESGFDDDPGAGDLVPLDRDTEPWVVGAPPSDADQKIRSACGCELRIQMRNSFSNLVTACAFEPVEIDHDDVA